MMKDIKKEAKLNSLKTENKGSGFVSYKSISLESFKNNRIHKILKNIRPKLQNLKRLFNSVIQKPRLWVSFIDWKAVKIDSSNWMLDAFIEGIIANWWTHKIFGLDFGIGMIFAHGFLIKQGLSIYLKLKKDGTTPKLLTKNN